MSIQLHILICGGEDMNRIWLFCISVGIFYALVNQNGEVVNAIVLEVGKDTFDFVVPLLCVTCFGTGY